MWILIILLHGWGQGMGSNGNAVASVEFSSQQTCAAAADAVQKLHLAAAGNNPDILTLCVQK